MFWATSQRELANGLCVSYPLLDGVFVIVLSHGALLHSFVFELENGVDQHQDAQRQDAGDHHGDGVDRRWDVVDGHYDVYVIQRQLAVAAVVAGALHVGLVAAHPVAQDGLWIPGFHCQLLVVELPVLLPLIEVCVV